jgi:uncharacterized protein with HEPN domain
MKTDPSRVPEYLRHILEAISRILEYTDGMNEGDFSSNLLVQDAVIRNIEILGEASRNIEIHDPTFVQNHPQIPLHDTYLMRNRLTHGYFSVDLGIVWNTIQNDLPALREQINLIVKN